MENAGRMLSVVIPAYNEADGIADIIERVLAIRPILAEAGVGAMELIVVDDGSKDRTAEIVASYADVRLVHHGVNQGYGAALKTGFCAAEGELVGFLDADGTYPPEYFPLLCQEAINGADIVVGSRRSGASSEMPLVRRIGNFLWSNLVTLLSAHRVIDPASGMRVFRREIFGTVCPLPDGLNFTPVMSSRAVYEGLKMVEIPIPYTERRGASKLRVIKDGMRFLQTIVWTSLTYNPVRILGGIGVVSGALSAAIALTFIILRLSGVTTLGPWGVAGAFLMVVMAMAGIDYFALGATFNYLVSLFHNRPIRQGLFGKPLFKTPLEREFGWIGLASAIAGVALGIVSLILGLGGWQIERLWLYLLAGTLLILLGLQLGIFWIIMRVLEELSHRDELVRRDRERGIL